MPELKYQSQWEALAQLDAKWAILTRTDKKFDRWDEDDFFETGREEIEGFLDRIKKLGITVMFGRALDFGCGIGRLSKALGEHFEHVCGVDISQEMVHKAEQLHHENERMTFIHNPQSDLSCLEAEQFDLVYSHITLQHVPRREVIKSYLGEFIRVLKPGGLLYFQLPTVRDYGYLRSSVLRLRGCVFSLLVRLGVSPQYCFSRLRLAPYMHMSSIPSKEIKALLAPIATILRIDDDNQTYTSYFVRKGGSPGKMDS